MDIIFKKKRRQYSPHPVNPVNSLFSLFLAPRLRANSSSLSFFLSFFLSFSLLSYAAPPRRCASIFLLFSHFRATPPPREDILFFLFHEMSERLISHIQKAPHCENG